MSTSGQPPGVPGIASISADIPSGPVPARV